MIEIIIEGIRTPCYLIQSPFSKIKSHLQNFEENKDYYKCYKKNGLYYPDSTNIRSKIAISALCPDLIKLCDHTNELHYLGELLCAIKEEFAIYDYDSDNQHTLIVPNNFFDKHDDRMRIYLQEINNLSSHRSLDKKINLYLTETNEVNKLKKLINIDQIFVTLIQELYDEYDFTEYIGVYE